MPPRLGLFVQSETTYPQSLHAFNSLPPDEEPTSPIFIKVGSETKLLRAFLDFKGQRNDRLTHIIGVGDPSGTHYVYDLNAANLVCVWHGDFVDATPMWHDRGDGSFRPMGAVQYLFNSQPHGVSCECEAKHFRRRVKIRVFAVVAIELTKALQDLCSILLIKDLKLKIKCIPTITTDDYT